MSGEPPELSETLPAVAESVPRLRRAVTGFAAEAGASGMVLESLRLAVTEAVTNAIVHAYVDHDSPGTVSVIAAVDDGALRITVSDRGRGMLPRIDSPGLGLGMPLIAQAADAVDVHEETGGGVRLTMSFNLRARAEAALS